MASKIKLAQHSKMRMRRLRGGARASQIGVQINPAVMAMIGKVPVQESRDLSWRVKAEAQARAPRDTGQLAGGIGRVDTSRGAYVYVDTGGGYVMGKEAVGYGAHVELGTQFMDAKPFMRPALLRAARVLIPKVKRALQRMGA